MPILTIVERRLLDHSLSGEHCGDVASAVADLLTLH
jgi:hypothetical protein